MDNTGRPNLTPGPWEFDGRGINSVGPDFFERICNINWPDSVQLNQQRRNDMRLLASSLDMLCALEDILRLLRELGAQPGPNQDKVNTASAIAATTIDGIWRK